jgi:TadE-like protein
VRRVGRATTSDRGAVAIEAAVIFPVILLLAVGVAEWSLVLRDQIELTSVSRAGARTASAVPPVVGGSGEPFTQQVVDSIGSATSSLQGSLTYVLIYRAGSDGMPLSGELSCDGAPSCARYDWDPGSGAFVATGATWAGSDIDACAGDASITRVGVLVASEHRMVTGIWSDRTLTAHTVMSFEPQRC